MASPQKENGFTSFANELLEHIIKSPFTAREYRIILALLRATYGYQKKSHGLSNEFLSVATGLFERHVKSTLKNLISNNVVIVYEKQHGKKPRVLGINKNYEDWIFRGVKIWNNNREVTKSVTHEVTNLVTQRGDQISTQKRKDINKIKNKYHVHGSIAADTENEESFESIILNKFIEEYQNRKHKKHPPINLVQRGKIFEIIKFNEYLDFEMWSKMILHYLEMPLGNEYRHNANHFFTGGIIENRLHEIQRETY